MKNHLLYHLLSIHVHIALFQIVNSPDMCNFFFIVQFNSIQLICFSYYENT